MRIIIGVNEEFKKMKEIGSYFWDISLEDKKNDLFNKYTCYISGRAALKAILQDIKKNKNIKTALIPSYCCESMIKPFIDENINCFFYPIEIVNDKLDYSQICDKEYDIVLLIDYFGFSNNHSYINRNNKIIIRDITHSIFSYEYNDFDYCFASLRKWDGFVSLGLAYKKNGFLSSPSKSNINYTELKLKAMKLKNDFIKGITDNKEYLEIFNDLEELLDKIEILSPDKLDKEYMDYFSVEKIKKIRRENAQYLIDNLKDYSVYKKLEKNDCPLFVPIITKNRDELKKYLIKNKVYCPNHWPLSELHNIPNDCKKIYYEELSLICDQRYTLKEMEKIVNLIKKFEREKNVKNI